MAAQAAVTTLHSSAPPLSDAGALTALVGAIEELSNARTVEDIAQVVRRSARELSGADGVAVVVRDGDRCHYIDEDSIAPLWKGMKFPLTACVSGWAMLNKQTAVIPDIYVDPRVPHDAYRPTFVKSLVMTPVRPADPVAAIGAYWAEERNPTAAEINALEAVSRATATAFENVNLYNSLTESIDRRDFLIRELDHRVKNTLASVQAIASQTLRTAADQDTFVHSFNGRLQAMSRAHELLAKESWKSASLDAVILDALTPFGEEAKRISVIGPPIILGPVQAVAVQLAFHELCANAMTHGALSTPMGRVAVEWRVDRDANELILNWQEGGGPKVGTPTRRGMGLRLIERGLPHAMDAVVHTDFASSGFRVEVRAPLTAQVKLG